LRLLILVTREGFRKDKCGPRAKKFEHHCFTSMCLKLRCLRMQVDKLMQAKKEWKWTISTKNTLPKYVNREYKQQFQ